jgi:hypothetical protein
MLDLMADDLATYRADPDGATYYGKEGFLEATADWTEGFSEWAVVRKSSSTRATSSCRGGAGSAPVDWHVEAGDLPLRAHGLGRESGVEVRREAFQLWDMRDGKAIRW